MLEIPHFSKIVTFLASQRDLRVLGSGRWGNGKSILGAGLENKFTKIIGYFVIIIIMFIQ